MLENKLLAIVLFAGLIIVVQAKEYSQAEIYQNMCQRCHGTSAKGDPKKGAPSLIDKTQGELAVEIYELKGDGYQSSGTVHDVMSYNIEVIEKKGMHVNPDKMAEYIYSTFK